MSKRIKKMCTAALTLAITAASAMRIPVSAVGFADITSFSDFTIIVFHIRTEKQCVQI